MYIICVSKIVSFIGHKGEEGRRNLVRARGVGGVYR